MSRIDFIHKPRADGGPARTLRAFLASCACHGLALGLILGLAFLYRSQMPPPKSGSAPGSPSITLETMVIVSPPPQPPASQPPKPLTALPPPAPTVTAATPPPAPEARPAPPEATVPVLAVQPNKPMPALQPIPAKIQAAIHPAISITAETRTEATAPSPLKPAALASPSSYAPGLNMLPHPPYPIEARDRGQTGTVVMNVQFDARGGVVLAEVAQSSGVPLLDSETRSFIRLHWRSPSYAGQTVSVPVQYRLENL